MTTKYRYKAIFIAPFRSQADYWANQWGYKYGEWDYVNNEELRGIYGWWQPDIPVYVCGTDDPSEELWLELRIRGFEVYNAETLNVPN